jgi:ADP-heptose:LPS heptosyltransferase
MTDRRLDPPPGLLAHILTRSAARLWPLPANPPDPASIRSVLVVRTDRRLGNALLTIPLVRALQRALPQATVDLLLSETQVKVADGLPGLGVIPFHRGRLPLSLRRAYEVAIDAAHWHAFSTTSALLSRWVASRWVIGSERGPSLIYSRAVPPPPAGMPEIEAKLLLARALGIEVAGPRLETALGRGPSPVSGAYVAINPGGRKADHRLPPEVFAVLCAALPVRSVVFWGPGEEQLARSVVATAAGRAELAPATDLDQLASAFRAAALVVTNDTGPLHLAVACGAPVLGVFKDEAGLRWAHPGPRFEAVVAPVRANDLVSKALRLLDSPSGAAEPAPSPEGPRK